MLLMCVQPHKVLYHYTNRKWTVRLSPCHTIYANIYIVKI